MKKWKKFEWKMTENQKKIAKMFEKWGKGKTITVEMKYSKEVDKFLRTIEEAHEQAKHSKLRFGYESI